MEAGAVTPAWTYWVPVLVVAITTSYQVWAAKRNTESALKLTREQLGLERTARLDEERRAKIQNTAIEVLCFADPDIHYSPKTTSLTASVLRLELLLNGKDDEELALKGAAAALANAAKDFEAVRLATPDPDWSYQKTANWNDERDHELTQRRTNLLVASSRFSVLAGAVSMRGYPAGVPSLLT